MNKLLKDDLPPLIGLKVDRAEQLCKAQGWKPRAILINGRQYNSDNDPYVAQDRINFWLEDGYVVKYFIY